jgi:uncharacterized repeat protein (TIGR03803 family)
MKQTTLLTKSFGAAIFFLAVIAILSPQAAHAQTFTVLHQFTGNDGYQPYGTLLRDGGGNLYGTTFLSLPNSTGTVFKLKNSHGVFLMSSLLNFNVPYGGPYGGVAIGPGGAIFGMTFGGGASGDGMVYATLPPSNPCRAIQCPWSTTVIHSFLGGNDGAGPWLGSLIYDQAGNLYGTTVEGGPANDGTVFKVSRVNGSWTETVLYSFAGDSDGAYPYTGVTMDAAGNLYGTTAGGGGSGCSGGHGCGTVFELSPAGSGWNETILYRFAGMTDGANPLGGVTLDHSGNLYGTTSVAGANQGGTVFELSPSGGGWRFTLLAAAPIAPYGGPAGNLAIGQDGALYGTTVSGDNGQDTFFGQVFKVSHGSGGWTYTTLHQFTGPDGESPYGGVILDPIGNLYGTASEGGTNQCQFEVGCGTVWEITP